jgi:PIN domain nuclease of toxin-antitoxin system
MQLLIDTHIFLWWESSSAKMLPHVHAALANPANSVFVSAASAWEISIKRRMGKLNFMGSVGVAVRKSRFDPLDIGIDDAELAGTMPWSHTDPFDRLLVAQSERNGLTLVTADYMIRDFAKVPLLWAR